MKVIAVIAELNPCHAGHAWFLQEARRLSGADCVIVVMSGDFVQRGEPAVFDKYVRTEMALACGADLVLELPVAAACGSAQRFAEGAVSLLDRLGVVSELWFGSEAGDIEPFRLAAARLSSESGPFREELKAALAGGLPFPAARERAITRAFSADADDDRTPADLSSVSAVSLSESDVASAGLSASVQELRPAAFAAPASSGRFTEMLRMPNNILGLEYCLALQKTNSSIVPRTLRRSGAYHSEELAADGFASASAIRRGIQRGLTLSALATHLPESLLPLYEKTLRDSTPLFAEDFSSMLLYQLQKETAGSLTRYLDVPEELANRLLHLRDRYDAFSSFAALLKTKNRTLAQIRRALLHILLGITPADLERALHPSHVRVLGFSAAAAPLLSAIQEKGQLAPVSKASALSSYSSERDVFASRLYEAVRAQKAGVPATDEFRRPVITVP